MELIQTRIQHFLTNKYNTYIYIIYPILLMPFMTNTLIFLFIPN